MSSPYTTLRSSKYMYLAIGPAEIGLILLGVVILFGARKLPGLARAMDSSVTQFKRGLKEDDKPEEIEAGDDPEGSGDVDAVSGDGSTSERDSAPDEGGA